MVREHQETLSAYLIMGTLPPLNTFKSWGHHMPAAVLFLSALAVFFAPEAHADFNCFESYGDGRRCACVGTSDCSQMRISNSCKSDPQRDKSELGADHLQLQGCGEEVGNRFLVLGV